MRCDRAGCRKKATLVVGMTNPKSPIDTLIKLNVCSQEHVPTGFTVTEKVEGA